MEPPQTPSLYDRLGGVYNIAVVVDDLIDRVMDDARLNANPRVNEAHHRVSPRNRDGLLGGRRPAEIYRSFDGRLSPASYDHGRRMERVHG